MNGQNYYSRITVNTIQKAFEGICNVAGWWATNFKGNSINLNGVFTVRFGKTFAAIKITELVQDKKITWRIIGCYLPLFKDERQWENTEIVWEISKTNNATEISMTHVGLTPEKECYTDCEKGWNFYVKETNGEQVISTFNVDRYNKETFNVQHIKGEYFMILKDELSIANKSLLDLNSTLVIV